MSESILADIRRLGEMSVGELHIRYVEVFGEASRSRNKAFLRKRIAWRIQELAEGGLSERFKERARALARDEDLRIVAPRGGIGVSIANRPASLKRDPRLPSPGATITREFRGTVYAVKVLEDGFEYLGNRFKSLSAVARAIAGTRWNGWAFFGLSGKAEGV